MSRLRRGAFALACLAALVAAPLASAAQLPGAPPEGWVRWSVAKQPGSGDACCYNGLDSAGGKGLGLRGCALQGQRSGAAVAELLEFESADPQQLQILVRFEDGMARAVRAFSADCPIRSREPVRELAGLPAAAGLEWLRAEIEADPRGKLAGGALVAIALQAGAAATEHLIEFSGAGQPQQLRRDASFWLGQSRGDAGIDRVLRLAREEPDAGLVEHLAFVLSQSDLARARQGLRSLARGHADLGVRGQSLFWIAQADWPDAETEVLRALRETSDEGLEHAAVFALSQLKRDSDAALIRLLQGDYSRRAKRQALFWLGQSGSDQAVAFLDRYLAALEP